jgi:hypothetical protein
LHEEIFRKLVSPIVGKWEKEKGKKREKEEKRRRKEENLSKNYFVTYVLVNVKKCFRRAKIHRQ